jgi:hypothetical protein
MENGNLMMKKRKIEVNDYKYYWRSGIWEFNDNYTSITHNERNELYLKKMITRLY